MSYDPRHLPPPPPQPTQTRAWPKRHPVWSAVIVLAAIPFAAGGISALSPQHHPPAAAAPATTAPTATAPAAVATTAAPAPSPTPTPTPVTVVRTVTHVEFKVSGAGTPSITYGSDSDNISPQGGLGFDGQGEALPWHGQIRYHSGALYWNVTAQLEGDGNITCKVLLKVTRYWSDGTHFSKSKVIAHGHAAGGYNICSAQYNNL